MVYDLLVIGRVFVDESRLDAGETLVAP